MRKQAKFARPISEMKTLEDIQHDMSVLYNEVREGRTELKHAAELANIAGKYLKAEQLKLAREIFISQRVGITTDSAIPLGNGSKMANGL